MYYAEARAGSFVLFSRDVLHTFSASVRAIVLISYQSPSMPIDYPAQYTLPLVNWSPWMEPASTTGHSGMRRASVIDDGAWLCCA